MQRRRVAGLMTTGLPQTSATIPFQAGIATGKFHGVTRPTTPIGARTHIANLFGISDGVVSPKSLRPSPRREEGDVDRFLHVAARLGEHLAHLARHLARDLLLVAAKDLAGGTRNSARRAAGISRHGGTPSSPRRPPGHVVGVRVLERADQVGVVRRVAALEGLARLRGDPLAVDVVLMRRRPGHADRLLLL